MKPEDTLSVESEDVPRPEREEAEELLDPDDEELPEDTLERMERVAQAFLRMPPRNRRKRKPQKPSGK